MSRRRALIAGSGAAPHLLAAARALAAAGWDVGLALTGPPVPRSRAVARVHPVPPPERGPDAFVAAVADVAGAYEVVLAADDIELLALSAGRAQLPCAFPHAAHEDVVRAVDKLELARAAGRAGLQAPRTRPATPEVLAAWRGPAVVKARLHWQPGAAPGRRHLEATPCASPEEADTYAREMRDAGVEPLLQAPVDGELMAVTTVVDDDGAPVAVAQQRSSRLSLRRTSCRAATVAVDPGLAAAVGRLLADLRWRGLANLQFLRPAGGEPHLIDLNGRLYGSLALTTAAGLNLPDLWARLAVGDPVPSFATARPGVRFQALAEDLQRARRERRGGLLRDVASCLAYAPGAAHPHASLRDPLPGAAVAGALVAGRLRRRPAAAAARS